MIFNANDFFEFDKGNAVLLNAVIDYLFIEFKNNKWSAMIRLSLPHRNDYKQLDLKLSDISDVSINQNIESIGQQIHNYKFLVNDECMFYLSLDPDESSTEISLSDQDVFIFSKLEATIVESN